jgi:hypothetical protein
MSNYFTFGSFGLLDFKKFEHTIYIDRYVDKSILKYKIKGKEITNKTINDITIISLNINELNLNDGRFKNFDKDFMSPYYYDSENFIIDDVKDCEKWGFKIDKALIFDEHAQGYATVKTIYRFYFKDNTMPVLLALKQ